MKTWQLAATHTHLYPGARLQCVAPSGARPRWRAGDRLLVAFADCVVAGGALERVAPDALHLRLDAYRTAKGTCIATKAWRLQWLDDAPAPPSLKVKARVP